MLQIALLVAYFAFSPSAASFHDHASPCEEILDALAVVESSNNWHSVTRGCAGRCWGAYQQSGRFADVWPPLLLCPPVARWQAKYKLNALLNKHDGRLSAALAEYNCGAAGARRDKTGRCRRYANKVLATARAIHLKDAK